MQALRFIASISLLACAAISPVCAKVGPANQADYNKLPIELQDGLKRMDLGLVWGDPCAVYIVDYQYAASLVGNFSIQQHNIVSSFGFPLHQAILWDVGQQKSVFYRYAPTPSLYTLGQDYPKPQVDDRFDVQVGMADPRYPSTFIDLPNDLNNPFHETYRDDNKHTEGFNLFTYVRGLTNDQEAGARRVCTYPIHGEEDRCICVATFARDGQISRVPK